ncbi:MAG: HPr(Ser) kinase/phosphatase [Deltaproteobacteria bacterium]|nr:HPr(Ser) kinase/phosphatase [Deltaproteobacteria bacterium]
MPHVTVRKFLAHVQGPLALELLAGEPGLDRPIASTQIQKPGLALAGFTKFVRPDRVQVLGQTEISYLSTLEPPELMSSVEGLLGRDVCCLVITKGLPAPDILVAACARTSTPLMRTTVTSSVCIRRLLTYLDDLVSPRCTLHGGLVDVNGVGVLIVGASGIGKSECALDLVLRKHRLVADDVVEIRRRGEDLVGQAPPTIRGLIEVRGIGILNVAELYGVTATREHKRIELHVELIDWHQLVVPDRMGLDERTQDILGVAVRSHKIPVKPGRNVAGLIEVAARDLLLRRLGRNAPLELTERIRQQLEAVEASADVAEKVSTGDVPILRTLANPSDVHDHIEDEVE